MVNRRGLRLDRTHAPTNKKRSAMKRLVPFLALAVTLATVSAPLIDVGTAAAFGNPSATTSAATGLSGTGATLNGTVNANGETTTVTFCYSTASTLANCGGATSVNGNPHTTTSPTATETGAVTGLTPNTKYYFQIEAANFSGTVYGSVLNFTTTELPGATTSAATSVTTTGATFNGSVNAENASTSVSFCYSTTSPTNCSGATVVTASPASASGTSSTTESAALERPGARHRVLLPDRGDQQRRHFLWLGPQLHDARRRHQRHDERGDQRQRQRRRPSTARSAPTAPRPRSPSATAPRAPWPTAEAPLR